MKFHIEPTQSKSRFVPQVACTSTTAGFAASPMHEVYVVRKMCNGATKKTQIAVARQLCRSSGKIPKQTQHGNQRRTQWGLACKRLSGWAIAALLALHLSPLLAEPADANQIVVVSRRDAEISKLSLAQVSRIFLGQSDALPSGALVTPVDAPEDSALYIDFYSKVLGKTLAQLKTQRARQSYTGSGVPPRQAATLAQAFRLNSNESLVITYIRKRELDDHLQVVLYTGKQ